MGLPLFSKKESPTLRFTSRAEAFAYMLAYQMEEKKADPMEAAKKANEFADIFATNMGIPTKTEPPAEGVEKYIKMAEKIGDYCDQHPRAIEFLTGAVTFAAGLFSGKAVSGQPSVQESVIPSEKIDFNQLD